MLGWLWRTVIGHFTRCPHKWGIHETQPISRRGDPERVVGTIYGLRCEHCGDITQRYVGLH